MLDAFGGQQPVDHHRGRSVAGIKALPGQAHCGAAQRGVVGLTKKRGDQYGEYGIRVNSIHPWGVATPMAEDPTTAEMLGEHPNSSSRRQRVAGDPARPMRQRVNAIMYLASDLSRAVTGTQLTVDMGTTKV